MVNKYFHITYVNVTSVTIVTAQAPRGFQWLHFTFYFVTTVTYFTSNTYPM